MGKNQKSRWPALLASIAFTLVTGLSWPFEFRAFAEPQAGAQNEQPAAPSTDNTLAIDDRLLPRKTYPHAQYQFMFQGRGNFVPPLHWRVEKGTLPPGLIVDDSGLLHGQPQRAGEYHFTVSVTDSGKPQQSVQKDLVIDVVEALTLVWKALAHVSGSRVEGSVLVSNTTPEDIDLTYIVEAVAENGRATAIGYQHFLLQRGTAEMELPFGENLPNGKFLVNVDAIGEVPSRNVIFRRRLQTPAPLHVVVGP